VAAARFGTRQFRVQINPRARADLKQVQDQITAKSAEIEKEYQEVLVKDPTNIQANWDMAQLKKNENHLPQRAERKIEKKG